MDTASWYYVDYASGTRLGPFTLQQLDSLHEEGKIEDPLLFNEWALAHPGPGGPQGIQYSLVPRINVQFVPTVEEFHAQRAARPVTVLSGPNNCGKTLLLKQCGCKSAMGVSHWLQPLLHVDVLNSRQISKNDYRRFYDDFRRQYETSHQNIENNPLGLEIIITSLKDTQRTKMFRLCEDLLGNHFSLKRIDADNEFSPFMSTWTAKIFAMAAAARGCC
jgi:hypothetical protein